jgi:hypothetical protein
MSPLSVLRSCLKIALVAATAAAAVDAKTPRPAQPALPPAAAKPQAAPPPAPDITLTMQYRVGDKTTASTVAMKGARQRIDYGAELVVLQECDLGRIVQLNEANRRFLIAGAPPPRAAPPTAKSGGVITYTTTVVDTGERKDMFNMTARHVRTTLTKDTTGNACDRRKERVETDGWYIDAPADLLCANVPATPASSSPECQDDLQFAGADSSKLGYPVAYTMTTTSDDGKASTMAMEVSELTRSTLPASMFMVPDGYVEVKTLDALARSDVPSAKKAGALRVGVAPIGNKAGSDVSMTDLHEALVVSLGDAEVDTVPLSGATIAELTADARANDADFILTTEVAEVKQGGGGMLGKISGAGQAGYSAKVDFKLLPAAGGSPRLSDSERSGTSTLKMALGAAKVVSFYASPIGVMRMRSRYTFMAPFSDFSGGASPYMMQQSPDPVLNTVFGLVNRATSTAAPADPGLLTPLGAVASAMEREVNAVASALRKNR